MIVAVDGSGDFLKIQDAIDAIPDNNQVPVTINIRNGVYREKLTFPHTKSQITIIGEDQDQTIITYDDRAKTLNTRGEEMGTFASPSVFVYGSDFTAKNITFANTAGEGRGQAVAVRAEADRIKFINCVFKGHQDTLFANGENRQYYYRCQIAGDVDFIFGSATAVFEECEIISLRQSGGYLTAASTPQEREFGYVFLNCRLTGDVNPGSVWLGRPWRPYGHTAFINTYMDESIQPTGWHNWGKESNEETARYEEFGSTGPGATVDKRVKWSKQLDATAAASYTIETILNGNDGWNPKE